MDKNLIEKFIAALAEFIKGFFGVQEDAKIAVIESLPKFGDKSEDVRTLQEVLNFKFRYNLKEDGIFGDKTSQAVIETKKLYDYYPSNIVTVAYLNKIGISVKEKDPVQDRDDAPPVSVYSSKADGSLNVVELDIKWQSKGKFNTKDGKPVGSVLHYTVSGNSPSQAINVANYFARTPSLLGYQLACPIMDRNGTIYIPKGWKILGDRNNHAGTSSWNGYSGLSATHTGLEVCSWGMLDSSSRSKVAPHEIRTVTKSANIKAGDYQKYTEDQELHILNWYIYHLKNCPHFKIENICGHDECSPSRKSDPGGSLSMTMPEFRALVKKYSL